MTDKFIIKNLGQIKDSEIELGDLTIFVGPQATGKTILLQAIRLILDDSYIKYQLEDKLNMIVSKKTEWNSFLESYLGEGLSKSWKEKPAKEKTSIKHNRTLVEPKKLMSVHSSEDAKSFLVPASRVMIFADGLPRSFDAFDPSASFTLREFSHQIKKFISGEKKEEEILKENFLNNDFREMLSDSIFRGWNVQLSIVGSRRSLVLKKGKLTLPIPNWSAGQREFLPLLFAFNYLMPGGGVPRAKNIEYVIIEEPEMGLHPYAICTVMYIIMELIRRGYKVIISTHSPATLDIAWAIGRIKELNPKNKSDLFLEIFKVLKSNPRGKTIADVCLNENTEFKTYFFDYNNKTETTTVKDISSLDVSSDKSELSGWGGLTGLSGEIANIVAKANGD